MPSARGSVMLLLLSSTTLVLALTAPKPCAKVDDKCPRPPCPPPPPGYDKMCEIDANPLVINSDGLCCPQAMCDILHCPSKCMTDDGTQFVDGDPDRASPHRNHYYDCSRTDAATRCFKAIMPESQGDDCHCLIANKCISSQQLLKQQESSSKCVLSCRDIKVTGANICPDYDDTHDWCNYYASFFCVSTHKECDASLVTPKPTTCEEKCLTHPPPAVTGNASLSSVEDPPPTPEDKLDRFLRCLGDCSP